MVSKLVFIIVKWFLISYQNFNYQFIETNLEIFFFFVFKMVSNLITIANIPF